MPKDVHTMKMHPCIPEGTYSSLINWKR